MLTKKDIDHELVEIDSLKILAEAYGEIAASRMMKIRKTVLENREYLKSIDSIFKDALIAYSQELSRLARMGRTKESKNVTFLSHNGRKVAVFLSANTGFYGEVLYTIFKKFLEDVRNNDYEITIVGKVGRSMFMEAEPNRVYSYFDIPDLGTDKEKLGTVLAHLVQYEELHLYYGKYISIVKQDVETSKIVAGTPVIDNVEKPKESFIFEPSLEKILQFFEAQIFASLFEQALQESQLAKLASRMLAMQSAQDNIQKRHRILMSEHTRFNHQIAQKKQINTLLSVFKR